MKRARCGDLNTDNKISVATLTNPKSATDRLLRRKQSESSQQDQQHTVKSVREHAGHKVDCRDYLGIVTYANDSLAELGTVHPAVNVRCFEWSGSMRS